MGLDRKWTIFMIEAEEEMYGVGRLVKAHNEQIAAANAHIEELEELLHEWNVCALSGASQLGEE